MNTLELAFEEVSKDSSEGLSLTTIDLFSNFLSSLETFKNRIQQNNSELISVVETKKKNEKEIQLQILSFTESITYLLKEEESIREQISNLEDQINSKLDQLVESKIEHARLESATSVLESSRDNKAHFCRTVDSKLERILKSLAEVSKSHNLLSVTEQEDFFFGFGESLEQLDLGEKNSLLTTLINLADQIMVNMGLRNSASHPNSLNKEIVSSKERDGITRILNEKLKDIVLGDLEIDQSLLEKLEYRFDAIFK